MDIRTDIFDLDPVELRQGQHHTRSDLSVSQMHDLYKSIKAHGQIVPIDVYRACDGKWEIWDGCRRTLVAVRMGERVKAREIEPFATLEDARLAYHASNYVRRNAAPSAIIFKLIYDRLSNYKGRRRNVLRWMSYDLGITQKRLERYRDMWEQLLAKDPRVAKRAIVERWSVHEVGVALGFPDQRERNGMATRKQQWSAMRPEAVKIRNGADGNLQMICTMKPGTDARAVGSYVEGKRWPAPVLDLESA